jgi:hypothetical protein
MDLNLDMKQCPDLGQSLCTVCPPFDDPLLRISEGRLPGFHEPQWRGAPFSTHGIDRKFHRRYNADAFCIKEGAQRLLGYRYGKDPEEIRLSD